MDAFDADVLIYAAADEQPLGLRVLALFPDLAAGQPDDPRVGSVLLLPELLIKPERQRAERDLSALSALLSRIRLVPVDRRVAEYATSLGAQYGLRTVDAVHLASAVHAGADRFITNNRRDFTKDISEIDVTYPDDLPEP